MSRFYIEPDKIEDDKIILDGQAYRHAMLVRRCSIGDRITVIDGTSKQYEAEIERCDRKQCIARIRNMTESRCESAISLTLFQSIIKIPRFETILQKSTELGVSSVIPMISERTVSAGLTPGKERIRRWENIIRSAACQSGRVIIPVLGKVRTLEQALKQNCAERSFIFSPEAMGSPLKRMLRDSGIMRSVSIFIGPEGGFSQEEIEMAKSHGVRSVFLGNRILRAETAAIVSIALILYELE